MNRTITPVSRLSGSVHLPPATSIAHRAALLAAIGDGRSEIHNYSGAEDPQSTLSVLRALGIEIGTRDDRLVVHGVGADGFLEPTGPLDCGNSGTTMRLLAGLLAGQHFPTVLLGDASLSRRPMGRIARPLEQMGASVSMTDGHAPLLITPGRPLHGITYRLPVASAQVKSCVLLAGLLADAPTTVVETTPSRDHTERMLGLSVASNGHEYRITVEPGTRVKPASYLVPADFSAAAFFIIAATIVADGEIRLPSVGLNPSRCGLIEVLGHMGGRVEVENPRLEGGEPVADLTVRGAELQGIDIEPDLVPNVIDEIPVLCVAAACARGTTTIRGAKELRAKETDRIGAMVTNLRALGCDVDEFDDGLAIHGGRPLKGTVVQSFDDHRIAMSMAIGGLVASGGTTILDAECTAVSYPGFWSDLDLLTNS